MYRIVLSYLYETTLDGKWRRQQTTFFGGNHLKSKIADHKKFYV